MSSCNAFDTAAVSATSLAGRRWAAGTLLTLNAHPAQWGNQMGPLVLKALTDGCAN
jgi:hypothetical protein